MALATSRVSLELLVTFLSREIHDTFGLLYLYSQLTNRQKMKRITKHSLGLIALLTLAGCGGQTALPRYEVEVTAPQALEGEWLYLAPIDGNSQGIDSARVEAGKALFCGDEPEAMRILRTRIALRLDYQELLLVTEKGRTYVTLDSLSYSRGTPQNEALNRWKLRREQSNQTLRTLHEQLVVQPNDTSLRKAYANEMTDMHRYTLDFASRYRDFTVGSFLYQQIRSSLSETERAAYENND